jgi:SAM-dependent methyltransferase
MFNWKEPIYRWISPVIDVVRAKKAIPLMLDFMHDLNQYKKLPGAEKIRLSECRPALFEKTASSSFDSHYFYQDIWAFKRILSSKTMLHVDVGSKLDFIGFLSAITHVTFIDIRPLTAKLNNLESKSGTILSMPFDDGVLTSVSCLHVAEHIGLGRYGDPLDPFGTKKAAAELTRILAPGGYLYFSLPIGTPRIIFNSHRIHSTQQVLDFFSDLTLVELSGVDDNGNFSENIERDYLDTCSFGCGFFIFFKKLSV